MKEGPRVAERPEERRYIFRVLTRATRVAIRDLRVRNAFLDYENRVKISRDL